MLYSKEINGELLIFHAKYGLVYKKRYHNGTSTLVDKYFSRTWNNNV